MRDGLGNRLATVGEVNRVESSVRNGVLTVPRMGWAHFGYPGRPARVARQEKEDSKKYPQHVFGLVCGALAPEGVELRSLRSCRRRKDTTAQRRGWRWAGAMAEVLR